MRILMVLTYYRPHVSGLTLYAQRLAEALASRGHQVRVLTSRHEADLPLESLENGVQVVRAPVLLRLSKGIISPALYYQAFRLLGDSDMLLLHLPQFDSGGIALLAKLRKIPVVVTYHCDLQLPEGVFNSAVNAVVRTMNALAGRLSEAVVAYTTDFAEHSPFLRRNRDKCHIILPPAPVEPHHPDSAAEFARRYNPRGGPAIGLATRFAAEKGIDVLLDALPAVFRQQPDATVLFAGQYRDVWGEAAYFRSLAARIADYEKAGRFVFLGVLNQAQMRDFYDNLDVLTVPSVNNTESFGLVQIEAMQCGCPVVATDLPGVRQPVGMTGAGEVVPAGNPDALAKAILRTIKRPRPDTALTGELRAQFSPGACADRYTGLFEQVLAGAAK
ncbi:MAG: glycosyltransferase family 4 protein [Halioglobus sp.]|nr:glycosyltransferase family 4 protein [Halioglobus sp.]